MLGQNFSTALATTTTKSGDLLEFKNKTQQIKNTIYSIVFIVIVLGNLLLITAIVKIEKLQTNSNVLIVHLAVCDIAKAIFGIALTLVVANSKTYPFFRVGCQLIFSVATHSVNAIALTLVCIACERYLYISKLFVLWNKTKWTITIFTIHFLSFAATIPIYVFSIYDSKEKTCKHTFPNITTTRAYTIVLFLIQYGIPLPLLVILYSMTWFKIKIKNSKMIQMTEEYERRMAWESAHSSSTVSNAIYDSNVEKDGHSLRYDSPLLTLPAPALQKSYSFRNMKNGLKFLTKPPYISRTSYIRHKQTITTFKMFLTIVMVFAIFSLPNQIIWIVYDFYNIKSWSSSTSFLILEALQFTNAVLNCWIYGGYSKTFRSGYKYLLCYLFTCGKGVKKTFYVSPKKKNASCVNEMHEVRQRAFSNMFQDQIENFEKYRHLYKFSDEDSDSNDNDVFKQNNARLKRTITDFISSLHSLHRIEGNKNIFDTKDKLTETTKRDLNFKSQSVKLELSMLPPIIPAIYTSGNTTSLHSKRRKISAPARHTNNIAEFMLDNNFNIPTRNNTDGFPKGSSPNFTSDISRV